jgi:hypothetical protein
MPRRPRPLLLPCALLVALAGTGAPARADDDADPNERYTVRGELGAEVDTNAHRTEIINVTGVDNEAPVSSPLARGVLGAAVSDVVGDGHQVAASATIAGKLFEKPEAHDEDVGIVETSVDWRAPVGARAALALDGGYYEAFQRTAPPPTYSYERRDFRSLTPTLRFLHALGDRAELGVGGGYRVFVFKSDRSFDFQAPMATLDLRWGAESSDGAADWEATLRATFERRVFDGHPFVAAPPCPTAATCSPVMILGQAPPVTGPGTRVDDFTTGTVELARTGRVLLGAGYALHVNRSNSFGETVMRHFLTARFAAALPFDLFVAAHAEILFARYADNVVVAETDVAAAGRTFVSIEDENRNSVRLDLSRNLTDRLQLLARYTYYANELGSGDVTYRRQTALLSLAFTIEK